MNKNFKRYLIVLIIFAAIYSVLVFAIPYPKKNVNILWMTYIFSIVAIAAQLVVSWFAFKKETLKSRVLGLPLVTVGWIYLACQLGLSVICLIVNAFVSIPNWIYPVITVVLIGLTAIGLISVDTYREEIIENEEQTVINTKFIDDLKIDSSVLVNKTDNDELKKKLQKLADEIKYSDPVSSDSLTEIEDEISRKYTELKQLILENNTEESATLINDLLNLITERNQRCKESK